MLRFVTLCTGAVPEYHTRAWMWLLTTMVHAPADSEYVVCTDHPGLYAWFGQRVRCVVPDATVWSGPQGYFWRHKIMAFRAAAAFGPADVVYVDCDMVARRGFADLTQALARGDTFLHEFEYTISRRGRRGDQALWQQVRGRTAHGLLIQDPAPMWNAGLIGLGAAKLGLADDVLAMTDELTAAGVRGTLVEQLSWSLRLAADGHLRDARAWYDHYWANKPGWDEAINALLARILVEGLDVPAAVELVRRSPIRRPLAVRRRWWNRFFIPFSGLQGHLDLPGNEAGSTP